VIFKIKTKDFDERNRGNKLHDFSTISSSIDYLYTGSKNTISHKVNVKKTKHGMFLSFVNKNRLESVISKEGNLRQENKDQFAILLFEDAMKDYSVVSRKIQPQAQ
jgi:hypothetical protein